MDSLVQNQIDDIRIYYPKMNKISKEDMPNAVIMLNKIVQKQMGESGQSGTIVPSAGLRPVRNTFENKKTSSMS